MNDWGYACFAQLLGDDIITLGRPGQARATMCSRAYRPDLPADVIRKATLAKWRIVK